MNTAASQMAILSPAAALIVWTLVMLGWMVLTRFPAFGKAGIDLSKSEPGGRGQDLERVLPPPVMWKAHNHTHLHEQPTLFYAVVAILAILDAATHLDVAVAWGYVALRVVHSVYQATVNVVTVRFGLFALATLLLIVLAVRALFATL